MAQPSELDNFFSVIFAPANCCLVCGHQRAVRPLPLRLPLPELRYGCRLFCRTAAAEAIAWPRLHGGQPACFRQLLPPSLRRSGRKNCAS